MTTRAATVRADLDRARNLYGPLDPDARSRILAAIEHPTVASWQAARGLIVCADPTVTLWQAVVEFSDLGTRSAHAVPTATQIAAGLAGATR